MRRAQTLRGWYERTSIPDIADTARPVPSRRKDTKRWCGGKSGREHVLAWRNAWPGNSLPASNGHFVETCVQCGKKFRYCWPFFPGQRDRECFCGNHGYVEVRR